MMKSTFTWVGLWLVFFPLAVHAASLGFSVEEGPGSRLAVEVVDQARGTPVGGAEVVVGERLDQLAQVEAFLTGWDGATEVVLTGGERGQAVLVRASGYVPFAILGVSAGRLRVYLRSQVQAAEVIVTGRLGGFPARSGSDRVQAGFVFRALSVFDLVQFQFNQIISPLRDTIDVFGSREIPANLVLPDQQVSIPFSSIHLNKPDYRLPLHAGVETRLAAIQGEIRSGDLIDLFVGGGKMDFGALNLLKMTKVGLTDVHAPREGVRENFETRFALAPKHTVSARAAPFPADVVVAAAVDTNGDRQALVPTDLKTAAKAGQQVRPVRLMGAGSELAGERVVAALAIAESGKRLSGIAEMGVGDSVTLPEFRRVNELADFSTAPGLVQLSGVEGGLASLTVQKRLPPDSEGKPRVGEPLAVVYALPRAGVQSVAFGRLGLSVAEVGRFAVSEFELGAAFDPARIDADRALDGLKRFTRAMATYKRDPSTF